MDLNTALDFYQHHTTAILAGVATAYTTLNNALPPGLAKKLTGLALPPVLQWAHLRSVMVDVANLVLDAWGGSKPDYDKMKADLAKLTTDLAEAKKQTLPSPAPPASTPA